MELDITVWVERYGDNPERFSDSIANSGLQNIGQVTWRNAMDAAEDCMLVNDANRDELVDHFAGYGAWERAELEANSDAELNALLLQFIAGDYQGRRDADERGELEEYEQNEGGRLYVGDGGRWFYYVGG
jgi:hypothetical protein